MKYKNVYNLRWWFAFACTISLNPTRSMKIKFFFWEAGLWPFEFYYFHLKMNSTSIEIFMIKIWTVKTFIIEFMWLFGNDLNKRIYIKNVRKGHSREVDCLVNNVYLIKMKRHLVKMNGIYLKIHSCNIQQIFNLINKANSIVYTIDSGIQSLRSFIQLVVIDGELKIVLWDLYSI